MENESLDIAYGLQRLTALLNSGAITLEEFETQKNRLLAGASPAVNESSDIAYSLEKLADLRDSRAISQEEYETQKERLLTDVNQAAQEHAIPPQAPPVQALPYALNQPPSFPVTRPTSHWRWICLVVAFLGVFVWVRVAANAKLNDAKAADELAAMLGNAQPGDADSIDTSTPATTEKGEKFRLVLVEVKKAQREFAEQEATLDFETLLAPNSLGTDAGRTKLTDMIGRAKKLYTSYYGTTATLLKKITDLTIEMTGEPPSEQGIAESENKQLMDSLNGFLDSLSKLSRFVSRTKPGLDSGQLVFNTDAEIDEFNKLTDQLTTEADGFDKMSTRIDEAKRTRMKKNLEILKGGP